MILAAQGAALIAWLRVLTVKSSFFIVHSSLSFLPGLTDRACAVTSRSRSLGRESARGKQMLELAGLSLNCVKQYRICFFC